MVLEEGFQGKQSGVEGVDVFAIGSQSLRKRKDDGGKELSKVVIVQYLYVQRPVK